MVQTKAVLICGSPRKGKNTDSILDAIGKGLQEYGISLDKVYLSELRYSDCIACSQCKSIPGCALQDDMQQLYQLLDRADIIVIGSPMYFLTPTATVKAMIDRAQAVYSSKEDIGTPVINMKRRLGFYVATFGMPKLDPYCADLKFFFRVLNAQYVGDMRVSTGEREVSDNPDAQQLALEHGRELAKQMLQMR